MAEPQRDAIIKPDPKALARIIEDTGWQDKADPMDQRRGRHEYERTVRYADDEDMANIALDLQRIKKFNSQQPVFAQVLDGEHKRHIRFKTSIDSGG